jgi:hypothetical protein
MKLLPFILIITLIGCSRTESPTHRINRQIQQWIPEGTSLASARQILEQHQFTCSVVSYDNIEAITNNPDAVKWATLFAKTEAVTNISLLNGDWTDKNNITNRCKAGWIIINNKTVGLMWWTVSGK